MSRFAAPIAEQIWDMKYRLKEADGTPVDVTVEDTWRRIAQATGEPLRALLRTKQPEYLEQGLDNPALTDDQLLDAMLATPVLINRPIVVTPKGARLGRPVERILEVL